MNSLYRLVNYKETEGDTNELDQLISGINIALENKHGLVLCHEDWFFIFLFFFQILGVLSPITKKIRITMPILSLP